MSRIARVGWLVSLSAVCGWLVGAGCLFPSYTFDESRGGSGQGGDFAVSTTASGGGGPAGSSTEASSSSGAQASAGGGGAGGATAASSSSASSSSSAASTAASSGAGGGVVIAAGDMIDDMEDGTSFILQQGGRVGTWYSYNDGTGTQTPIAGGPFLPEVIAGGNGMSTKAAHTFGSGFTTWGAGMGFDLHNPGGTKSVYDVTPFTGVAFWAKGTPAMIRFNVLTQATVAPVDGGTCSGVCGDSFGTTITLTGSWTEYVVPFSSLGQVGWGTPAAWAADTALSMQFQVTPGAFDFWIDDIGFYH